MSLEVGALVTPSVRLVRPLGAGGMGAVWVADHLTLRTQVVVKFMANALATDPASIARFSREAASASNVKSPHVVQMLDHGITADGVPFIIMELLEGNDLGHRLRESPILSLTETNMILAQACKALGRAHERGIVHRDIKPDNIFLCNVGDRDVFVKLLDFGIAKASNGDGLLQTKTGAFMGTPYYMSPEQVVGLKGIDHRTDLWSLGVVVFEALTGKRPFDADNVGALIVAIQSGPIPKPSSFSPALPPAVDAWFLRACAREPGARFSSAREMSDAFEGATRGGYASPSTGASAVSPNTAPALASTVASGPPFPRGMSSTGQAASTREPNGLPRRSASGWLIGGAVLAVVGIGIASAVAFGGHLKTQADTHALTDKSAPAASSVAVDPMTPEERALGEAKRLCATGDCDQAHKLLAEKLSPDSLLRKSADFEQVESNWAEAMLARAEHETDVQKKRDLLSSVAQASGVRPPLRESARGALAKLTAPSTRPTGVHTAPPSATAAVTTAEKKCNPPYVVDATGTKKWKPECL